MKFEAGKIGEDDYGGGFTERYFADTVVPQ